MLTDIIFERRKQARAVAYRNYIYGIQNRLTRQQIIDNAKFEHQQLYGSIILSLIMSVLAGLIVDLIMDWWEHRNDYLPADTYQPNEPGYEDQNG